jgi:hypothetical protein
LGARRRRGGASDEQREALTRRVRLPGAFRLRHLHGHLVEPPREVLVLLDGGFRRAVVVPAVVVVVVEVVVVVAVLLLNQHQTPILFYMQFQKNLFCFFPSTPLYL